ncbi:peptidoglycan-binding protein [Cellulomonas sp. C5510]|uniref:peptidoglycan-binding domain-containing protein n=1 Tax=Cellulomonas sp. C5510 TaxID=2871170 RepID=UPI001C96B650|nr:peptidoglycan-binding protein [Cellulomonas sp. C5510]QZN86873.1 peptidoglycan-binding protein [Cellulomonas sp. C5510]
MSILDLDPSGFPLGPWAGDGTWTDSGFGGTIEAVTEGDLTVLRLTNVGPPAELTTTVPETEHWTVHLVASILVAPQWDANTVQVGANLIATPGGAWLIESVTTGTLPGRHLITMTSAGGFYLDGELLGTFSGGWMSPAVSIAAFGGEGHSWTLARLIAEDGVSPTLAADMAALVDQYLGGGLTASGTWSVTGAGVLTVGEDPIPDPPAATPGGSITPPPPPEPQLPPAGVPNAVIRRYSETMPTPVLDARSWPTDWAPTSVVDAEYGRVQVVVEGVDVTYYLDVPMEFPSWSRTEPFGSSEATLRFPQITAFHALPAWCVPGASVDIRIAKVAGGVQSRFAGVVVSFGHSEDDGVFTINATGAVMADDLQLRQPSFLTAPRDIGDVIAEVLNTAVSRRHSPVAPVVTGCQTSVLGGWEPRVTGYVQQLLATAITGGQQWTVRCDERAPIIALKDTTTVQWTVHNGQRGVQIDLAQDWSQAPNVLYGEGIGSDGGRWRNARYPNWRPDDTPPYPNANPSKTIRVGTTDSMTDTGAGVSDWQRRVGLPATGRFTQADRAKAIEVQTAAGIQRDGIVGPQTWAATFGTGSNTGTLECFYMPLAYSPAVMPRLYGPDGDDLGANPAYDANTLRVEEKIDFGQGVSKDEGARAAGEILARDIHPGWAGTVTFTDVDPQERSRFEIQEGLNGRIRGYRGTDLVVHAAAVDYSEDTVTVTVDTNARDYPRLDAIRDRERNATDPAKAAVKRLSKGSVTDARATFDAESPAGHIPRFALFSNLWSVIRVPFGSYGSVVRTEITTTAAREFSVAVFDRPITAAQLLGLVGNPLTAEENPWSNEDLDDAGMLMSWGWYQQPAGYWPGEYSDPDGETSAPLTGKLVDDASWDYASTQAPWLWVALIASGSCYVQGRFWPGAD